MWTIPLVLASLSHVLLTDPAVAAQTLAFTLALKYAVLQRLCWISQWVASVSMDRFTSDGHLPFTFCTLLRRYRKQRRMALGETIINYNNGKG